MITVLLILHLFVTIALIATILIQRSEGGGLGIGTSQGMGAFMTGRGTANLLTRTTAALAGIFMVLSLSLAILNRGALSSPGKDILANPPPPPAQQTTPAPAAPVTAPAPQAPVSQAPVAPPQTPASPAPAEVPQK